MKKLHLIFLNGEGNKHTLIPVTAAEDLTEPQIRTAMTQMTELAILETDKTTLFQAVSGAKYVETIETAIFQD